MRQLITFGAVTLLFAATLWANQISKTEAQIFDRLMNMNSGNSGAIAGGGSNESAADRNNVDAVGQNFRKMLNNVMSVNVPVFYDMIRNGSSLGINVLSGLVKVERGEEAERNGLVGTGRRPLSVRVFGVPVFERGQRVRDPKPDPLGPANGRPSAADNRPESEGPEEELPIES